MSSERNLSLVGQTVEYLTTELTTSNHSPNAVQSSPATPLSIMSQGPGRQTSHPYPWAGKTPLQYEVGTEQELIFQGIHTTLTILALGINCISLMVIYGLVPRLTPPLRLLTSLSFADMLAPWAIMTLYFSRSSCQDEIHTSVLLTAHNAVALTLLMLSIIHNCATFKPLHYDRLTAPSKLWASVGVVWAVSLLLAHVHFVVSAVDAGAARYMTTQGNSSTDVSDWTKKEEGGVSGGRSYCERVEDNTRLALILAGVVCVITIGTGAFIYIRILLHLRPVEAFLQSAASSGLTSGADTPVENTFPRKSTRGVINGVILLMCYALWIPYLVSKYSTIINQPVVKRFTSSTNHVHPNHNIGVAVCQTLVIIGCAVNPVVSGCRMTSLQLGYIQLGRRLRGGAERMCLRVRRGLCRRRGNIDEIPTTPLNQIDSACY